MLSFAFAFFRLPDACQPSLQSRRNQKPASPVALTRKIRAKCPVLLVFGLLACHFRANCLVLLISGPPTCQIRAKCPVLLTSGPPTCQIRAKCPVLLGFGDASSGEGAKKRHGTAEKETRSRRGAGGGPTFHCRESSARPGIIRSAGNHPIYQGTSGRRRWRPASTYAGSACWTRCSPSASYVRLQVSPRRAVASDNLCHISRC